MKTHYKPYHHHPPQTFRGTGIEDKETMPKYSGFKPTHALSSETRKRARQHLREKLKSMKPTNGKGIAAGEMRNLLESSYLHGEVEGWEKDPTLCTDTGCSYVSPDGKVSLWSDKYTIENKHKIFKLLDSWIGYLRGFMFEVEDGKLKSIINKK